MSVTDITSRVESQVASRTGFLAAIQAGRLLTPQALSQSAGYAPVTATQISDLTATRNTAGCWATVYATTSNFNAAAITGCVVPLVISASYSSWLPTSSPQSSLTVSRSHFLGLSQSFLILLLSTASTAQGSTASTAWSLPHSHSFVAAVLQCTV